jgi:hypothetical protein
MLTTLDVRRYEELGARLGEEIGNKLVARLGTLRDNQAAPRQFKGGVPFAALSASEATEFVEVLPFVGEYVENAETFAADGVSLEAYLQSRLYDERGCPMAGCIDTIGSTLRSAMRQQSELFSARYPVRHAGLA